MKWPGQHEDVACAVQLKPSLRPIVLCRDIALFLVGIQFGFLSRGIIFFSELSSDRTL